MKVIPVHASRSYEVRIESGLLPSLGAQLLTRFGAPCAVMLVSDDSVYALYGAAAESSLRSAGFRTEHFVFPHGENSKTLSTYAALQQALFEKNFTRSDVVVALGGGVAGDLAGFASATCQRGLACVQVPTTLLAMVDASVGGKTGVNLAGGKNQVGAFSQPALVLCDPSLLATLPDNEYKNGCAEVVKCAMLSGEPLFSSLPHAPVEQVIAACVEIKRDLVQADEYDAGCRRLLNFGHTVGHAIESCSGYAVPHGFAVAAGMAVLTRAACCRGLCGADTLGALRHLLDAYGLSDTTAFSAQALAAAALSDKKRRGESLSLVLPEAVGRCRVETIPAEEFVLWLRDGGLA